MEFSIVILLLVIGMLIAYGVDAQKTEQKEHDEIVRELDESIAACERLIEHKQTFTNGEGI